MIRQQQDRPPAVAGYFNITAYFAEPDLKTRLIANIQTEKQRLSWETFATNPIDFYHKL